MPAAPKVEKPRLRGSDGTFSARGTLSAKLLRKVWSSPATAPRVAQFDAKLGGLVEFRTAFVADKVDTVNAVIRGVSVITSGLIARGHDLEVDNVTLDQMKTEAERLVQVPVKVDHKSGAAAVCGYLTNFHLDGTKLKADWHLLKTHPQKDQILEVAERMPKGVGLSASFVSPAKPEKAKSGKTAARCSELISVDYVTLPAANPDGMFSAKVDTSDPAMTPEQIAALVKQAIAEAVAPLTEKIETQAKQLDLFANPPSLEEVAQMDEEQLAELGLTPADVQEALEGVAEEQGEAEGEVEGGEAEGEAAEATTASTAAPAASAPAATGFEALQKQLTEFAAELRAAKAQKAQAAQDKLFTDLEAKIDQLVEQNTHLKKQLETGGEPATPGVDRNGIRFFSANRNEGEFEQLVQLSIEEGKGTVTKAKAFQTVIKTNPAAYQDYLCRLGVSKRSE